MKLQIIAEQVITAFHGVTSLSALYSVLDNGFNTGERGSTYLGDLKTALAYSLDWWGRGGRDPNDKNAYVLEVLLNLKDKAIHPDEDAISFDKDTPGEDSSDREWTNYLNSIEVPPTKHEQFKQAIITYNYDGDGEPIGKLAKTLPYRRRPGDYENNLAIKRPLRTKGKSRIVAAYIFSPAGPSYQLTRVAQGKGTMPIGTTISPKLPGR